MSRLFHYTTVDRFERIKADGIIKPATAFVPRNERPAVWFSTHPNWEPTASKGLCAPDGTLRTATIPEMLEMFGGLVRIEVSPRTAPYSWKQFKAMSGIHHKIARGLYNAAITMGANPGDWFVSFDSVPADKWLSVELGDGYGWAYHCGDILPMAA